MRFILVVGNSSKTTVFYTAKRQGYITIAPTRKQCFYVDSLDNTYFYSIQRFQNSKSLFCKNAKYSIFQINGLMLLKIFVKLLHFCKLWMMVRMVLKVWLSILMMKKITTKKKKIPMKHKNGIIIKIIFNLNVFI